MSSPPLSGPQFSQTVQAAGALVRGCKPQALVPINWPLHLREPGPSDPANLSRPEEIQDERMGGGPVTHARFTSNSAPQHTTTDKISRNEEHSAN